MSHNTLDYRHGPRLESLDLFRFLAAMVVFLGHVTFLSSYGATWKDEFWAQSIHTGTFAVDFFFVLSGFVLSGRKPTGRWMVSRIIRLYPVYLAGLCFGALVNLASSGSIQTSLEGLGLSLAGIQSLFSEYQLVLNPPLWSLSVEIVLIPLFLGLYLVRKNLKNLCLVLFMSYLISIYFQNSVVMRAIPFFVLGSIISELNKPKPKNSYRITLGFLVVLYIFVGANIFTQISYSWSDMLIKFIVLGLLVYCLLGVELTGHFAAIATSLGKRSYALYAVHAPLVGIALGVLQPDSPGTFVVYVATLFVITPLFTEVMYRYIDSAAIKQASKYRKLKL